MADLGVKLKMSDYLEMNEFFEEMINYHSHKGHKEKTQIYKDIRVALFGNDYLDEDYNENHRT
tara:strand:- start:548 stop:736 length:189 start_codon:yes stop_codon:yes gene_type:complete